jgi:PAS domain S-box-containing protein
MNQKNLLKILFIEDISMDVELAVMELRKEKLKFEHLTVCTRAELVKALNEFKPDLIISDYKMPELNGLQALKVIKEFNSEIPFILFTGSINEETAVECMKAGAQDYVVKEHITRLPFAVKEALEQILNKKEMKATDLLLKDSEEKLQSIFSAAPVGIGLLVNGKLLEVNDSFCEMTGYGRKELIGTSGKIIFPTIEEFEFRDKETNRQIAEKFSSTLETRFKERNGNILNIILSTAPLDKNDLSKGFIFTSLDITKRKQVEIALSETEERFRNLYNDAVIGLYRTNSKGEILLANRTLIKMLGFQSFEELSVRNLNEPGYGPSYHFQSFIDQIERDGEVKDLEAIWICQDGKEIFLRESAKAFYNSEGKIIYYDGTVQDITEQRRASEDFNKMRNLFETLAVVSPVGIFRTDPEGYTTYVNPKWSELSGLSSEEAYGNGWLNAVHPEDRGKLSELWLNDFKARNESNTEYRFLKPDGSIIWVMGKAVPEVIDNEVVGYIGTITDITERKLAEETIRILARFPSENPDPVLRVDRNGQLLYANEVSYKLLTWKLEIGEKTPSFLQKIISEVLKEGIRRNIETEHNQGFFHLILFRLLRRITPIFTAGILPIGRRQRKF